MTTPKTAMVLSGGGSLGAVQVGMLQALSRAQLSLDMVIGSSVGALNGALFADDPTPAGADRMAGLWRGLRRQDIFPLTLMAGLKALLLGRDHLIEACALRAVARRALHMQRIEQARIPLHIVATDVLSGEEVLLSSGDVETALMASTAIPVVFPRVEIAGRYLVDGGVGNNTPIASAIALGAERIIVLPTGMSCAMREPPHSMAALAMHVMGLQNMRQLDVDAKRYAADVNIVIVPPLCPLGVSVFDFSQTAALIERAAVQTREWLAAGGLQRNGRCMCRLRTIITRRQLPIRQRTQRAMRPCRPRPLADTGCFGGRKMRLGNGSAMEVRMQHAKQRASAPISKDTPDSELARRAVEGEEAAFAAIMQRHNRLLFRTARSILKSDTEGEDALQDAYLHAWRALAGFRADARLSTWLVRIVANEALGRVRRRRVTVIPLDVAMHTIGSELQTSLADAPDHQPDNVAMRAQLRKLIEARIDRLPESLRTVFMLRAVEEMSVDEVARALEIPEATVRTRLFRARSLMRESLASEIDVAMADAFAFDGARCSRIVANVLVKGRTDGRSAEPGETH